MLAEGLDHEYAPISGFPQFTSAAAKLAFGENSPVVTGGLVSVYCFQNLLLIVIYSNEAFFVFCVSSNEMVSPYTVKNGKCIG